MDATELLDAGLRGYLATARHADPLLILWNG